MDSTKTQDLSQFEPLKAEVATMVQPIFSLAVTDSGTNASALDALKQVKALINRVELRRTELVRPINEKVKAINTYAKEVEAPLLDADHHLRRIMADFATAERRRAEAEQIRIEEEKRKAREKADAEAKKLADEKQERQAAASLFGIDEPVTAEVDAKIAEAEKVASLDVERLNQQQKAVAAALPKNTRTVWKFEIADPALVPREYLSPDAARIGEAVRGGVRDIQGVRIYQDILVVAR